MIKPAVKSRVLDESQPVTTRYTTYAPEVLESQLVETTTKRSIDPPPPPTPQTPPPNSLPLTKNSDHVSGHRVVDRLWLLSTPRVLNGSVCVYTGACVCIYRVTHVSTDTCV